MGANVVYSVGKREILVLQNADAAKLAVLFPLALAGCSGASLYVPLPQSHFAVPNGDYEELNHVKATVSESYVMPFQTPEGIPSPKMQRDAYFEALKASGGDLIVNGDFSVRTTTIPLLFVSIVTTEGTVEGTAAKIIQSGHRTKQ
jgi:hypothetical protein